jgi:hypothetical protein
MKRQSDNPQQQQSINELQRSSSKRYLEIIGIIVYFFLAAMALVLPAVCLELYGVYWAALAYLTVGILWIRFMPCTCRSGGFFASVIAMPIILGGVFVPVIAIIKLISNRVLTN